MTNPEHRLFQNEDLQHLSRFAIGDPISISLHGEWVAGMQVGDDQVIGGVIVNPNEAYIEVEDARCMPEIEGQTIGLAVDAFIKTQRGLHTVTFQRGIAYGQGFAYYLSHNAWPARGRNIARPEGIVHKPVKYGAVIVKDTVVLKA